MVLFKPHKGMNKPDSFITFKEQFIQMKTHTTNYTNTFIVVADDCPAPAGIVPPTKGDTKTVANLQFEMISKNPYAYTSDDVLFQVFVERNNLIESELPEAKEKFFSKGQACFRASPLTKRYGWGIHCDKDGNMAIYSVGSDSYRNLAEDANLKVVKAMKSSR
ncbi:DUF6157 family protein [Sphingobacterium olei]|nr:DUF6157 family protein [Sphingobacterium olei]